MVAAIIQETSHDTAIAKIAAEALIAMVLGIVGACLKAPESKDITWAGEMKTRCVEQPVFSCFVSDCLQVNRRR